MSRTQRNALVCLFAFGLFVVAGIAFHATPGDAKTSLSIAKVQAGRGGGADENVKTKSMDNDPKATQPAAPPTKGGKGTRSGYSLLSFDNWTGLWINLYVDGDLVGVVGPYGDSSYLVASGTHIAYARAEFTDGSYSYWGPSRVSCYGTSTWRLEQ